MNAIIVHIPAGNGYTVESLRQRAIPHIRQSLHASVDFSDGYLWANRPPETAIKVDLIGYYTQQEAHQMVRRFLEEHYGLEFSHKL